jgi:hypothetical protein
MDSDKPTHADNRPTPDPQRKFPREAVPAGDASDPTRRLEAESKLQAEAESRPVSGTTSRPYRDEKAVPVRPRTRTRDPADAAAQPRSATEK